MIAKAMLPRFGGSAGVWLTCMLFFQVTLLLGYLYAFLMSRYLSPVAQTAVHLIVLAASLCTLPLKPSADWTMSIGASPTIAILALLATTVGLPYFLLSVNSPLLQSWYSDLPVTRFPYGLFAWSNGASLLALLAYPILIEPSLPVARQLHWWSGAYIGLALLIAVVALRDRARRPAPSLARTPRTEQRPLLWVSLSACSSVLWLAVAGHLSQEVAAIPFLWVLPLSVYLLSFILCFERDGYYRRAVFRWLLPAAWIAMCVRVAFGGSLGGLVWELPVFLASLLICCMFCNGELVLTKPDSSPVFFYLMIALGGAVGAIFAVVAAPAIFDRYVELPIGVAAAIVLGLRLLYGYSYRRLVRLAILLGCGFLVATQFHSGEQEVIRLRNFYGTLQVSDAGAGADAVRSLYNGRTLHGRQFLDARRSRIATAFYGPESGPGLVLGSNRMSERRVGVVGLGAGTLAAYGRPGDHFRFYEIDPNVVRVASRQFRFLAESAASTDVLVGDGRLAIEREPASSFDVIVIDAFSDDTIPVHLLTQEAFESYFRHLRLNGVLLIHLTNRYLDMAPVIEGAAAAFQKRAIFIHNSDDPGRQIFLADWAIVSDNAAVLRDLEPHAAAEGRRKPRLWTDEHSSVIALFR
jgi:SAM-dependent methyltransferase